MPKDSAVSKLRSKSRIESRLRFANLAFFLLMSVAVLGITSTLLDGIINTVARDYVRYYSIRTIGTLNAHLNREIGLMTKAVHSKAIVEWFADEFNEEKRRQAYDEMQSFIDVLYSSNLYFGIESSQDEFSVDAESVYDDFRPYDKLSPQRPKDRWYFSCMASPDPYVFNVDIDKLKRRKLVWLNYRVTDKGRDIGVLATGLRLDEVIRQIFSAYDAANVRGLVIDNNGVIQMDSAIENLGDKLIFNNDKHIQEEFPDPAFTSAVADHIRGIRGFFSGKEEIKVVELKEGIYSYASIAPIEASNWTVVTLYNASSLFNVWKLVPVFAAMLGMFIVYAAAMIVMNRKLIVKPFNKLIQSLAEVEAGSAAPLFGMTRQDEFGDLARTISGMKDRLNASHAVLKAESERAERASLAKSQFLANMSHEMRTPLNAVIGMAKIAQNSGDAKKIAQCLGQIENSSAHLVGVINDILDMSKIEAGKMELHTAQFNIRKAIARTAETVRYRMALKRQDFTMAMDELIPVSMYGDEQRFVQVLTNLLANAEKFTPEEGSITLEAHLLDEEDGLCTLEISVTDSGIGISAEQQRRLFQSFEQADSGISRKFGGTGLGLAISKRIVMMMGGEIGVESAEGQGARFFFTCKMQRAGGDGREPERQLEACAAPESAMGAPEEANQALQGACILLVEDVEVNREIVLALLEHLDITFIEARNGLEAVDAFAANHEEIDLILMDIQMPELDGYEATRRIRSMPEGAAVPIIAMTANVFREDIEKSREAGMNGHIGKPIDVERLLDILRQHTRERSKQR